MEISTQACSRSSVMQCNIPQPDSLIRLHWEKCSCRSPVQPSRPVQQSQLQGIVAGFAHTFARQRPEADAEHAPFRMFLRGNPPQYEQKRSLQNQ